MNERIKQIAEQAGMNIVDDKFSTYGKFAEKFSELIIQKCISQIALIGVSNFENEDIMWTVETAITSIEKHFGVKE